MGVAKGYGWDILEPFVTSFARNCPSAELVLFVDDISDFTRDRLIQAGTLCLDVPTEYEDNMIIHARWKMFADYLEAHGGNYEQVFLTDTRDVICQSDVFAAFKGYMNWLGYTTYSADIRGSQTESKVNYRWLANCFGKEEADKLADRKIICCGTVIGTIAELKIFCRKMWNALKDNTVWGHEQAVMNYLVYENLLPIKNLIEIDVNSGAVLTTFLSHYVEVRDDKILRGDGGVPAVVHQYDRNDELNQLVDEIYRAKDFEQNLNFTDTRSTLEQVVCLLQADKVVEATRLFVRKYLSATTFGECTNTLVRIWELTSRKNLTPTVEILEAAVQDTLSSVGTFSANNLFRIYKILTMINNRAVNMEFKIFFANCLLKSAEQSLLANSLENCFICINMIEGLKMPPDKNFYLFVAKANRISGRKDAALAAYKRALELS